MDGPFSFFLIRESLPYFFGGEAENRCHQTYQGGKDFIHGGLGASSQFAVRLFGVEAVLQNIQINGGKVHGAEIVHCMVHHMELVVVIGFENRFLHLFQAEQCPTVQFFHIFIGYAVFLGIEVIEVAQEVAEGISDFPVYVAHGLDDLVGEAYIALVVHGGNPEAHHVGAVLVNHILGSYYVANRFTHLAAFAVHGEAVGEDCLVGGIAVDGNGAEEGGVEPAAVLVGAFQIEVAGIFHAFPFLVGIAEDAVPGGAGVKPYVHNVLFLVEMGAAAVGAFEAFRQQFFCAMGPPCIGAFFFHDFFHFLHGFRCDHPFAAVIAVESRNRHAPGTLTGNAPVLTVANHVVQTVMAPGRNETGIIYRFQCFVSEIIDGCKPLFRSSVDNGVLAAPAVCILMVNGFLAQQHACMSESGNDRAFCFPDGLAFQAQAGFSGHMALFIHGADNGQIQLALISVVLAHFKVVHAMSRSGMNAAGAGIQSDMVAFQHISQTVQQGMMEGGQFPFSTGHFTAHKFIIFYLAFFQRLRCQFLVHEVVFIGRLVMYPYIGELRVHADGFIGRNGPGSGGPDDGKELVLRHAFGSKALQVHCREFDINGRRLSVFIFNFCFSQCGFAVGAPIHSLLAFVNVALVGHFAENFQFLGFQMGIKGDIGVSEITNYAHADEIGLLDGNPFLGIGQAFSTKFQRSHVGPVFAGILQYRIFDRKSVGIPAGNIVGFIAGHMLVADNDILQCLVQCMADMNLAIGIRRSIMKNKGRCAVLSSLFLSGMIEVMFLPEIHKARFLLRQIAAHGEIRLRQM